MASGGALRSIQRPLWADVATLERLKWVGRCPSDGSTGSSARSGCRADCFLDGSDFDPERVEEYLAE
ncbi:MAG: hypothetical protein ACREX9_04020, partial [Gammaproteobacteria bacterium]